MPNEALKVEEHPNQNLAIARFVHNIKIIKTFGKFMIHILKHIVTEICKNPLEFRWQVLFELLQLHVLNAYSRTAWPTRF